MLGSIEAMRLCFDSLEVFIFLKVDYLELLELSVSELVVASSPEDIIW